MLPDDILKKPLDVISMSPDDILKKPFGGISMLPDDLLVSILSHLSVKEAAMTSVLSRQWENLWMFTSRLNFDATDRLTMMAHKELECTDVEEENVTWSNFLKVERDSYIKWINKELKSYKGLKLEYLRVCFDLSKDNQHDIDNWLRYAVASNIESLEMDLGDLNGTLQDDGICYVLSANLLTETSRSGEQHINLRQMNSFFDGFKSLKSLSLRSVDVAGEVLQCFLYSCPNLERLAVLGSNDLVKFEVSGPSLKLRHLEIGYCNKVKTIKISNLNLVSFFYMGRASVVMLENLPSLVEVRFGVTNFLRNVIHELSSYLLQVEILTLTIRDAKETTELQEFPTLTRLKQLIIEVRGFRDESLMGFASLLKVSSNLKRLVLQLIWFGKTKREGGDIQQPQTLEHHNLRVVELAGYSGRPSELEAAIYILKNAISLEQLIIDPLDQNFLDYGMSYRAKTIDVTEVEEAARNRAKEQFEGIMPSGVELSIL